MEPALRSDQIVLISRISYGVRIPFTRRYLIRWRGPKRGDIVVIPDPFGGKLIVKRCAALSGTELSPDGRILKLAEETNITLEPHSPLWGARRVPESTVLLLGDNPAVSVDSRQFGFVSEDSILGKVVGCRS